VAVADVDERLDVVPLTETWQVGVRSEGVPGKAAVKFNVFPEIVPDTEPLLCL
jgi:hypothetical protein